MVEELSEKFESSTRVSITRNTSINQTQAPLRRQRTFTYKHRRNDEGEEDVTIIKHLVKREKTEEDKVFLREVLSNNIVCNSLNEYEIEAFVDAMSYFVFPIGSTITKQGTHGSYFFVISEGNFEVFVNDKPVKVLGRGKSFGEIALIYDCPRSATIRVKDVDVKSSKDTLGGLWGVTRVVFRETLMHLSTRNYTENRAFLDGVNIFGILSESQKNIITSALVDSKFQPGDKIVTQGEYGDILYIIKQGKADVFIDGEKVRTLNKGHYFGERALLYDEPRSATVEATEETLCVSLGREILTKVLGNLNNVLSRNIMMEYLQNSSLLRQFTAEQLTELIESASIRDFQPGDIILHKEEKIKGIRFFIVLEGYVQLLYENTEMGIMERGDSFGEEYILSPDLQFAHTVKCITRGKILIGCKIALLTKHALDMIIGTGYIDEKLDYNNKMAVINKMYIFRYLSNKQRDTLIKAFKTVRYSKDEDIIKEGEYGDAFYIINRGEVEITKNGVHIRTLGKHDYFGERALLYDEPRSASVSCTITDVDLWVVEKSVFLQIVEPPMLTHLESRIRIQDTNVLFEDLDVIKNIGNGTFGIVRMVNHRPTGIRFALKCVSRRCIRAQKQQKHIKLEREIMAQNDHPFIIQLVKTFKDSENIYFLTELITGGELYDAIRKLGLLSRPQAQFYLASIILAFEYLHERQIAYRDLKPENILLDHQGYIKLIDFGCAKKINGRSYTLIGTPHYMAPEIILGKGYSCLADIWSFGVCLYEFICGPLPFGSDAQDQIEIFRDILTGELTFPDYVKDQEAMSLIKSFLCRVPEIRIGASVNGFKDIKDHVYFKGFDWDKLAGRAIVPPLIPQGEVYNEEDNEQPEISDQSDLPDEDDGWENEF